MDDFAAPVTGPTPRVRLPRPPWMLDWPRGVSPVSLWASARGVELLFRAPGERWFRVLASLAPQRPGGVEVRSMPGPDAALVKRLAKALDHRLVRSPQARAWLERAAATITELGSMAAFGGRSPRHVELDALFACITRLSQGPAPELDADQLDHILACAGERLGDPTLVELAIALHLAAGEDARAVSLWLEHRSAIEARDDRGALACTAMMRAYLGEVEAGQDSARALAAATRDPIDAREASELLEHLHLVELAIEQLRLAMADTEGSPADFDMLHCLADMAIVAEQPALIAEAAEAMAAHAHTPDRRLLVAQIQREAGAFVAAEATLEALLDNLPEQREARLLLAGSRLWAGDHVGAAGWVGPLAERSGDSTAARIRGACALLAGRSEAALDDLTRALELAPGDDEAKLWRAEALESLGRLPEARAQILDVALGDTPIWQLVRARIEERNKPGFRIGLDTWFIVDQNIRQLLGDATPAQTNASHERAIELLDHAIARAGGNRTSRLTTLSETGELRWLDGVKSPRQRSEQLQFESTQRPIDEVLARFASLAEAAPQVPFFVTYPAELLMWRGEYEDARQRFEAVWLATRTRWGYVGAGACAMLLGEDERALELWDEGKRYYSWLDAEATYCYRGELYRRRGEFDRARRDLELAVRARPTRLGAWANLALLEHSQAREAPLRAAVAQVQALCPAFAQETLLGLELELPGPARTCDSLEPDALARWMQALLERMHGNRSSVMYTLVEDGRLRVIPVAPPSVWHDFARRSLGLFNNQVLTRLALRQGL